MYIYFIYLKASNFVYFSTRLISHKNNVTLCLWRKFEVSQIYGENVEEEEVRYTVGD